jgi:hypothetical protein
MAKGKSIKAVAVIIIVVVAALGIYLYTAEGDVTNTGFGEWEQKVFVEYTTAAGGGLAELNLFNQLFDVVHNGKEVASIHYVLNAKKTSASASTVITFSSYTVNMVTGVNPSVTHNIVFSGTKTLSTNGVMQQLYDMEVPITNVVGTLVDGQYNLVITPIGTITYNEGSGILPATLPGPITKTLTIVTPNNQYQFTATASPTLGGYVTPANGMKDSGALQIEAHANTGYVFSHWTGTAWTGQSTSNPVTIQMTKTQTVTAFFTEQQAGSFEDFSTYTEGGDTGNYQSILNLYSIAVANMPRISGAYFQKAKPIGYADFTLHFTLNPSQLEQSGNPSLPVGGTLSMMLPNSATTTTNTLASSRNDGIVFSCRAYYGSATQTLYMQIRTESDPATSHREITITLDHTYDITITRTWDSIRNGGVITMDVLDNGVHVPSFTGGTPTFSLDPLVDPTFNSVLDNTNIQFFIPSCGRGGGGNDALMSSGVFSNYEFTIG